MTCRHIVIADGVRVRCVFCGATYRLSLWDRFVTWLWRK